MFCQFDNFLFYQHVVLSTWHFVNLTIINLLFCLLVTLSTCHFTKLPLHQLAVLWTCCFINLLLCQLGFQPGMACQWLTLLLIWFIRKFWRKKFFQFATNFPYFPVFIVLQIYSYLLIFTLVISVNITLAMMGKHK
jgi:hypothetical protein